MPITNIQERNRGNNPIHSSLKKIKYQEINATKEVKDFSNENYKTVKKEIKDTKRCKDLACP
jgi:hypothetical protein